MMKQSTQDEINDWAVNRYASTAAPSLTAATQPNSASTTPATGMLGTTSTPTAIAAPAPQAASTPASSASTWAAAAAAAAPPAPPAPTATPAAPSMASTPTKTPAPNVNVKSWYQSELGRDGDAAGIAYWQNRLNNGEDAQSLYAEFSRSAAANREAVKPVDWTSANSYSGPALGNNVTFAQTTPPAQPAQPTFPVPTGTGAAQIAKSDLTTRTVDKPTETMQGQIGNVLAENSPVLQQARADAMRAAAGRGMLNSTMAASGGEDALIRSAAGIASTDAGAYKSAADYNAAAQNQATMWNADQMGQMQRLQLQQQADAAARAQQMQIAQMQDATSRYQSEMSANTAKYNSDASYRQQMDSQKQSLANNIIANMDLSPDRKAAMLEALGLGASAKTNPDGSSTPGSGLAGAVYVIGSTAADLQSGAGNPAQSAVNTMMDSLG